MERSWLNWRPVRPIQREVAAETVTRDRPGANPCERGEHLWGDEFKGLSAAANRVDWNSLIERCQFAPFVKGQSQQVNVGDLSMRDDGVRFEDLQDTDIFRPEVMAPGFTKAAQDGMYGRDVPWPVWVVRMAGNAHESIFGQRTGCPGLVALVCEPAMGRSMMDMHRVSQSKEQIDIQQTRCHGISSRR